MEQGRATEILTIYNDIDKKVITQVEINQFYATPWNIWVGTIEQFLIEHPNYTYEENI